MLFFVVVLCICFGTVAGGSCADEVKTGTCKACYNGPSASGGLCRPEDCPCLVASQLIADAGKHKSIADITPSDLLRVVTPPSLRLASAPQAISLQQNKNSESCNILSVDTCKLCSDTVSSSDHPTSFPRTDAFSRRKDELAGEIFAAFSKRKGELLESFDEANAQCHFCNTVYNCCSNIAENIRTHFPGAQLTVCRGKFSYSLEEQKIIAKAKQAPILKMVTDLGPDTADMVALAQDIAEKLLPASMPAELVDQHSPLSEESREDILGLASMPFLLGAIEDDDTAADGSSQFQRGTSASRSERQHVHTSEHQSHGASVETSPVTLKQNQEPIVPDTYHSPGVPAVRVAADVKASVAVFNPLPLWEYRDSEENTRGPYSVAQFMVWAYDQYFTRATCVRPYVQWFIYSANWCASAEWFYRDFHGKKQGPFHSGQMNNWRRTKRLTPDLPVACEGVDGILSPWFALKEVASFETHILGTHTQGPCRPNAKWFYLDAHDKKQGPFPSGQMTAWRRKLSVDPNRKVACEGEGGVLNPWFAVKNVASFFASFPSKTHPETHVMAPRILGPFETSQMEQWYTSGQLPKTVYVKSTDITSWMPLEKYGADPFWGWTKLGLEMPYLFKNNERVIDVINQRYATGGCGGEGGVETASAEHLRIWLRLHGKPDQGSRNYVFVCDILQQKQSLEGKQGKALYDAGRRDKNNAGSLLWHEFTKSMGHSEVTMESINECKRKVSGAEKTTGSSASTADTLRRSGSGKRNGRQQPLIPEKTDSYSPRAPLEDGAGALAIDAAAEADERPSISMTQKNLMLAGKAVEKLPPDLKAATDTFLKQRQKLQQEAEQENARQKERRQCKRSCADIRNKPCTNQCVRCTDSMVHRERTADCADKEVDQCVCKRKPQRRGWKARTW